MQVLWCMLIHSFGDAFMLTYKMVYIKTLIYVQACAIRQALWEHFFAPCLSLRRWQGRAGQFGQGWAVSWGGACLVDPPDAKQSYRHRCCLTFWANFLPTLHFRFSRIHWSVWKGHFFKRSLFYRPSYRCGVSFIACILCSSGGLNWSGVEDVTNPMFNARTKTWQRAGGPIKIFLGGAALFVQL